PRPDAVTERRIAATLLTPHALRLLDPKSEIEAPYEMAPELDATINDIRALNLVNSLYLDQKQMEAMRAILTTAQQEYQALTARERDLAQQYLGVLRTAQASLSSGKFPPLANAEQQKALAEQRKALAETRTSLDERFLGEVRALLTPNQIDMVSNFVPCVVPVQSLTNPERVGQADNASVWEKQIARLRSVPEPRLEMAMARLAERVEETYRRKKHSEDEIEAVLARLPKVVRAARALDDAAFAVKKSELAHEIAVPDKPNAVGKALDERIVNFLLSPNLIPIYTARLSAATTAGR
ncbi:MAG: hypothetical protein MUF51_00820, partial [Vicinamibacteria bacterium]|nr:hypothetical protein [Vicinamibacteria bacterium]